MASDEELKAMGIKSDNVIICENCYEENEASRNTCKNCGSKLYKNNSSKNEEQINNNYNEEYQQKQYSEKSYTNKVASKFSLVVNIMKFLGYGATIIGFIALFSNEEIGFAFLCLICGGIATWLSTLFFEAISEGLQLLEDIKNK